MANAAGTLTDGEMLVALAAELQVSIPNPEELSALARCQQPPTSRQRGPRGPADEAGTIEVTEGALRVAIDADIFAGGGTSRHDELITALRPLPQVRLAAATARAHGVEEGATVDLAAGHRVLANLVVKIDPDAVEGIAAIVDGIPDAPANVLADGETVAIKARELAGAQG